MALTPAYRTLVALQGVPSPEQSAMVDAELEDRKRRLGTLLTSLEAQLAKWDTGQELVVFDTSVYIHAEKKLEALDIGWLLQIRSDPIHLIIPIAVVDELDGLKRHHHKDTSWRARYTLALLHDRLQTPTFTGQLQPAGRHPDDPGGVPRGVITAEVLLVPAGHVRLPITDDEIIDRATTIQQLAGRTVHLVTFDTGMSMRARAPGLEVHWLDQAPQEPEP